ncbi:MAG: hypothetical protein M3O22_03390 [Pseudomonadota bacterium]|nr:hypothetical protein [Pseudomonadota bacterium]
MKKRWRNTLWLSLAAVSGVVLFHTSYQAQILEDRLATLNRQILAEQESVRVLKAEWSYLNDPDRIERLSQQYLVLQPTAGSQFASLDGIPERLPGLPRERYSITSMRSPAQDTPPLLPARRPAPALPATLASFPGTSP